MEGCRGHNTLVSLQGGDAMRVAADVARAADREAGTRVTIEVHRRSDESRMRALGYVLVRRVEAGVPSYATADEAPSITFDDHVADPAGTARRMRHWLRGVGGASPDQGMELELPLLTPASSDVQVCHSCAEEPVDRLGPSAEPLYAPVHKDIPTRASSTHPNACAPRSSLGCLPQDLLRALHLPRPSWRRLPARRRGCYGLDSLPP